MYLVTGANLFGQWLLSDSFFKKFQTISKNNVNHLKFNFTHAKLIHTGWSYNIFQIENKFYLTGIWLGNENQTIRVELPEECIGGEGNLTMIGNDFNLIIVNKRTYTMWIISLEVEKTVKRVNIDVETPLPTADENVSKRVCRDDSIVKIVCTNNTLLCLSSSGTVYSGLLPSYLDTHHCEGKVCDVQCGYEHYVLLTDVGRVYTWGNGRRLQLGHGNLDNLETPTEVKALAGIKIIKISVGGWHTLALSEFGDLYTWGWNDTGQLGIKSLPDNVRGQGVLKQEGIGSYPLPTLIDLYDDDGKVVSLDIKDIACGSRHSAIMLEDNTVWTTGINKYGQLGWPPEMHPSVNYFKKAYKCKDNLALRCGPWCTILYSRNK